MNDELHPTLQTRRSWQRQVVATTDDGFHGVTSWQLTVAVDSRWHDPHDAEDGNAPTEGDWERMASWLDDVLGSRDLTYTLRFAPTATNLALYIFRSFQAFCPAAYQVQVHAQGETATVRLPE